MTKKEMSLNERTKRIGSIEKKSTNEHHVDDVYKTNDVQHGGGREC